MRGSPHGSKMAFDSNVLVLYFWDCNRKNTQIAIAIKTNPVINLFLLFKFNSPERANGLRYLRVGGRGLCVGAEKNPKPEKCS